MKKTKILFAVFCAMLLSGCAFINRENRSSNSDSRNDSSKVEDTKTMEVTEESGDVIYSIGDTIQTENWEITVNSAEAMDSIKDDFGSYKPDDGNKYIVVNVTAKNLDTDANTFLPSFALASSISAKLQYQEYEFSGTNLMGYDEDLHNTYLNPLSSKTGVMAFSVAEEVSENLSELHLIFSEKNNNFDFSLK